LQTLLHRTGAATIYVSDVPAGHPDFAAVQWWGTAGGFHGLAPTPEKGKERGNPIIGQYFETYPAHTAELDRPMEESLHAQWRKLADELKLDTSALPKAPATRGDWIRAAWKASQAAR
jgi:hypothetical protein